MYVSLSAARSNLFSRFHDFPARGLQTRAPSLEIFVSSKLAPNARARRGIANRVLQSGILTPLVNTLKRMVKEAVTSSDSNLTAIYSDLSGARQS